jgi:hypothetical protein
MSIVDNTKNPNWENTYLFQLEEQFFKNAMKKAEMEFQEVNEMQPAFEFQNFYERPEHSYSLSFFNQSLLEQDLGIKVLVDDALRSEMFNLYTKERSVSDIKRTYSVWKSPNEKTSDINRNQSDLMSISELSELMVTAMYVIIQDVKYNTGPLFNPERHEKQNDKNLDIGYFQVFNELEDEDPDSDPLYVVWVENVRPEEGKPREYHIHFMPAGRYYKPERYFLSHSKETVINWGK